jgi:hypothetical protein
MNLTNVVGDQDRDGLHVWGLGPVMRCVAMDEASGSTLIHPSTFTTSTKVNMVRFGKILPNKHNM